MDNNQKSVNMGLALISMIILAFILIGGFAIFKLGNHVVFLLAIVSMTIVALLGGLHLRKFRSFLLMGVEMQY